MEIKDVEALAELAKLDISEEEKQSLIKDFDSILAYVDMIKEVDVGDVSPEYMVQNAWREDVKKTDKDFDPELITSQFPNSENGFVKVKKIL